MTLSEGNSFIYIANTKYFLFFVFNKYLAYNQAWSKMS